MITSVLALLALIIAIMNGAGRGRRTPLWLAVALLALGMLLPGLLSVRLL